MSTHVPPQKNPSVQKNATPSASEMDAQETPVQLINNRQEALIQNKWQNYFSQSSQMKQLSSYQEMADRSQQLSGSSTIQQKTAITVNAPVAQMYILNLAADLNNFAQTVKGRLEGNERDGEATVGKHHSSDKGEAQDSDLDGQEVDFNDQDITVIGHGIPPIGDNAPTVQGYTATQLVNLLVGLGLQNDYSGRIDLTACMSGLKRGQKSFRDEFQEALEARGFNNVHIIGYEGFTSVGQNDTDLETDPDVLEYKIWYQMFEKHVGNVVVNIPQAENKDLVFGPLIQGVKIFYDLISEDAYIQQHDLLFRNFVLNKVVAFKREILQSYENFDFAFVWPRYRAILTWITNYNQIATEKHIGDKIPAAPVWGKTGVKTNGGDNKTVKKDANFVPSKQADKNNPQL